MPDQKPPQQQNQAPHACTLGPSFRTLESTIQSVFKQMNERLDRQADGIEKIAVTANDVKHLTDENRAQWKTIEENRRAAERAATENALAIKNTAELAGRAMDVSREAKWIASSAKESAEAAKTAAEKAQLTADTNARKPGDAALKIAGVVVAGILVAIITAAVVKSPRSTAAINYREGISHGKQGR